MYPPNSEHKSQPYWCFVLLPSLLDSDERLRQEANETWKYWFNKCQTTRYPIRWSEYWAWKSVTLHDDTDIQWYTATSSHRKRTRVGQTTRYQALLFNASDRESTFDRCLWYVWGLSGTSHFCSFVRKLSFEMEKAQEDANTWLGLLRLWESYYILVRQWKMWDDTSMNHTDKRLLEVTLQYQKWSTPEGYELINRSTTSSRQVSVYH